ncbi:VPA1262 family protein [Acidithiobacillus ferrooxidans]|uniref:VPA1262 family protein n=1 Tax=Acidithiobacillus ferrooxidans TaxID=920 RepID=UPI00214954FB|nr:VPA1262 family protein [Acidithiobacillus ferrooxidans]MCR1347050.1 VPA1262 family protein [Acidithiobacillus ferrooxidans]MCR1355886.1 VPA1262 family protein [Acidithiobacillus ferrooxidans]
MDSMVPVLDDLLNDVRLARLFSEDARHCALQLWILQIKSDNSIENRVVYGRLLPYNFSNERWSATDDDNFSSFGSHLAQIIRLSLYVKSTHCAALLRGLSAGRTVAEISQDLNLGLSGRLKRRFGTTALAADNLAYRPVVYLLNRDAVNLLSPSSPHGGAGAFSASITQTGKMALFRVGQDYDVDLTAFMIKHLNADTGLDFGGIDATRFGDLELLVFPALDDQERALLSVNWTDVPSNLVARFDPIQVPHFDRFQFCLRIVNGGQIIHSAIATAERNAEDVFECRFEISDQHRSRTDSTELEIFGFQGDHTREGTLCCRWRIGYIREIHLQGHVISHGASPVKFDWLEKATRPSVSARVKAALTINSGNHGFTNHIGTREADPWVPANRELVSLFARIHPPKSEGRFFLRWSQGDGEGRLQFVEWFRELMAKYQQHQIVIFDPYFEDAGLGLLLLCAAPKANYIVFTSLPKPKDDKRAPGWSNFLVTSCDYIRDITRRIKLHSYGLRKGFLHDRNIPLSAPSKEGVATSVESDNPTLSRINNLVASCEHNRDPLKRINLRIYGLKEGRLHDRYILIMGPDRLPVAGFNLSNSFQKAAENYPLLVTPIPADILLEVEQYKSGLVREAKAAQPEGATENTAMRLLFDSTASPMKPRRYEPLRFLEKAQTGDVLSVWTGEPSLKGLSGDQLNERMAALGLYKDGSLTLPEQPGLQNCLDSQVGNFTDFAATWEVIGEVLAHSCFGDNRFRELEFERDFLEFLARYINGSFKREHDEGGNELAVMDTRLFQEPVEALLDSPRYPDYLFYPTKYAALNWPEYFAIKFLWWYAPDILLTITEAQSSRVPIEPQAQDVMRLSLLSQIVSEISLSVQFDISEGQRDRLVSSGNGLLQWLGLHAIERQLEKSGGLTTVRQLVAAFSYPEQVRTLGWMIHRAAGNPKKAEIYKGLVAALRDALPATISSDELRRLVNSMRGHMRQLAWVEPWLFQDVIFPLLQNDRAKFDDACEIWVQELAEMLEKEQPRLFNLVREGQTTNITALLFACSSSERQQTSLKSMLAILKRQRRIVQQPLASTSDWTRWDSALTVSLWMLAFSRWCEYYMRQGGMANRELEQLSHGARALAMVRPMIEWRSKRVGRQGELAAFLDQIEELLASSDERRCTL